MTNPFNETMHTLSQTSGIETQKFRGTGFASEYSRQDFERPNFHRPIEKTSFNHAPEYLVRKHMINESDQLRNNLNDHPGLSSNSYAIVGNLGVSKDQVIATQPERRDSGALSRYVRPNYCFS